MTTLELRGGLLHSVHWAFPRGALASRGLSNSLSERRPTMLADSGEQRPLKLNRDLLRALRRNGHYALR